MGGSIPGNIRLSSPENCLIGNVYRSPRETNNDYDILI